MGWTSSHSNSNLEGGTNPGGRSQRSEAYPMWSSQSALAICEYDSEKRIGFQNTIGRLAVDQAILPPRPAGINR